METLKDKLERNKYFWENPHHHVLVKRTEDSSTYSIMEANDRRYVIIEDDALAEAIIERMLAAGCKMYSGLQAYMDAVPLKPKPTEFKPWW